MVAGLGVQKTAKRQTPFMPISIQKCRIDYRTTIQDWTQTNAFVMKN